MSRRILRGPSATVVGGGLASRAGRWLQVLVPLLLLTLGACGCTAERGRGTEGEGEGTEGEGEGTEGEGEGAEGEGEGTEGDGEGTEGEGEGAEGEGEGTEGEGEGEGEGQCPSPRELLLGDPCLHGCQCVSGLCWLREASGFCTEACTRQDGCPAGLTCEEAAPAVFGCVPPLPAAAACASHADCDFPYQCEAGPGWCSWPECRFAADCPADRQCHRTSRRCLPASCASVEDCGDARQFCDPDTGNCRPPRCAARDDCDEGWICHPVHRRCELAPACNAEGGCAYYNEICVDGLCEPTRCAVPCVDPRATCDPATGRCHLPCADGCPGGESCNQQTGRCRTMHPPQAVAQVTLVGRRAQLDGSASFDPEDGPLRYRWRLLLAPPTSSLAAGLGDLPGGEQARLEVLLDVPGTYRFGLHVWDVDEQVSIPDGGSAFLGE